MKNIKAIVKDIPIIFNTYQNLKQVWNKSKLTQIIIMNQVLKYNKRKFYKYVGHSKHQRFGTQHI